MMLLVDSGSSKTLWLLVKDQEISRFESEGYNPYYLTTEYMSASMYQALVEKIELHHVRQIYYYGAGCSPEQKGKLITALAMVFPAAAIQVESDLLAAARALLGTGSGFAAILGTGTNSCYYDGDQIVHQIDSLGFLAGDEGSGSHLGKKIIRAYVRDDLPKALMEPFNLQFGLSKTALIEQLYSSQTPNKYCASFALFAGQHQEHPYMKELIKDSFRDFFREIICKYPHHQNQSIAMVGSIAFAFSELLREVAQDFGMALDRVLKDPTQGLLDFHLQKCL